MELLIAHRSLYVGDRDDAGALPRPQRHRASRLERPGDERASLEAFIASRFARAYGAALTHFCPSLFGVRDAHGQWQAAVGFAPAQRHPLFLEQYLDAPIESALGRTLKRIVPREHIVEVGNLAAASPGAARSLIAALAHRFYLDGYRWAVFTATRELRNSFRRLRLVPVVLAAADPQRLREGRHGWGTYYTHDPIVMGGAIVAGLGVVRE